MNNGNIAPTVMRLMLGITESAILTPFPRAFQKMQAANRAIRFDVYGT